MFDAVMDIEITQVERSGPVVPAQHVCCKLGNEEAERWGKVVRFPNASVQLSERDAATTAGKDTWKDDN